MNAGAGDMQNNLNLFNRCYDEYFVIDESREARGIKQQVETKILPKDEVQNAPATTQRCRDSICSDDNQPRNQTDN